jgi:predicted RecB family nuclease
MITGSQLYDFVRCPHRVALDVFGNPAEKDEPNAFVELLWEQGVAHEVEIVGALGITADMSTVSAELREQETIAAMQRGEPLIYGGRISSGDMIGVPDLLEKRENGYIPGDIKSGSGFDGDESDGKLKKHYAFQLAHYANILENIGFSDGSREAFVIDRSGQRVPYILNEPQGIKNTKSWWDSYQDALAEVRVLVGTPDSSRGALAAYCKLCHWYSHCKTELVVSDDLTLIAELGRGKRDAIAEVIPTVSALALSNPDAYIQGKKTIFKGVGPESFIKFRNRAILLSTPNAKPYLKQTIDLPISQNEVYFDIETDPMRDIVYLHGFVERIHGQANTAKFIPFFTEGSEMEHEAEVFRQAWVYLNNRVQDSTIYYYSAYERTAYKKLAEKYPEVCSIDQVETLFELPAVVDLYSDIVRKATEWPTYDQSIKTLAQFVGFNWRDTHPSGAASIEWYHRWIETHDPAIRQRILDYNEDDCLATGIVVDAIRAF